MPWPGSCWTRSVSADDETWRGVDLFGEARRLLRVMNHPPVDGDDLLAIVRPLDERHGNAQIAGGLERFGHGGVAEGLRQAAHLQLELVLRDGGRRIHR